MNKCLFAWTEIDGYVYYPQYLNVSLIDDGKYVRITVRSKEQDGTVTAAMALPLDEVRNLITALQACLPDPVPPA